MGSRVIFTHPPTHAGIRARVTKVTKTYLEVVSTRDNINWQYEVTVDQIKEDNGIEDSQHDTNGISERHRAILNKYGIKPPSQR